ncbi:hypothetical protein AAHH78_35590, partial [Burkholderia pseudomallei]
MLERRQSLSFCLERACECAGHRSCGTEALSDFFGAAISNVALHTRKVLVADDHPIVLRAVTDYLKSLPGFNVVA